jgi:hypothetical protein
MATWFCSLNDITARQTAFQLGLAQLTKTLTDAMNAGKLPGDDPIVKDVQTFAAASAPLLISTKGGCDFVDVLDTLLGQLQALGQKTATRLNTTDPVAPFTAALSRNDWSWLSDLVKWGAIAGIVYLGYRAYKSISSDAYPVDRLPQYAGGKRKR